MTREWWILLKWTPNRVLIKNGMTGEKETIAQSALTGFTIANINKCDIGGAFERVYLNGAG